MISVVFTERLWWVVEFADEFLEMGGGTGIRVGLLSKKRMGLRNKETKLATAAQLCNPLFKCL